MKSIMIVMTFVEVMTTVMMIEIKGIKSLPGA